MPNQSERFCIACRKIIPDLDIDLDTSCGLQKRRTGSGGGKKGLYFANVALIQVSKGDMPLLKLSVPTTESDLTAEILANETLNLQETH